NIDAVVNIGIIVTRKIMIIGGPDKRAVPYYNATNWTTGPRPKHASERWVISRHTQWRAPRDQFTPAAWNKQPGSIRDIRVVEIAHDGRVKSVGRCVQNIVSGRAKIFCERGEPALVGGLPLPIHTILRENI